MAHASILTSCRSPMLPCGVGLPRRGPDLPMPAITPDFFLIGLKWVHSSAEKQGSCHANQHVTRRKSRSLTTVGRTTSVTVCSTRVMQLQDPSVSQEQARSESSRPMHTGPYRESPHSRTKTLNHAPSDRVRPSHADTGYTGQMQEDMVVDSAHLRGFNSCRLLRL